MNSDEGVIKVWNIETGICENILNGHKRWVNALAIRKYGSLISGAGDRTIKIWDIEKARIIEY